ncbi:hypothetical protein D1872_321540 [compost metagenome]
MDNSRMTYRYILCQHQRLIRVHMTHDVILNIGTLPNDYWRHISSKHRIEPY